MDIYTIEEAIDMLDSDFSPEEIIEQMELDLTKRAFKKTIKENRPSFRRCPCCDTLFHESTSQTEFCSLLCEGYAQAKEGLRLAEIFAGDLFGLPWETEKSAAEGFYVYAVADRLTSEVHYLGKGVDNRAWSANWQQPERSRVLRDPDTEVLILPMNSEDEAFAVESYLISRFGGNEALANYVVPGWNSIMRRFRRAGYIFCQEAQEALRAPLLEN